MLHEHFDFTIDGEDHTQCISKTSWTVQQAEMIGLYRFAPRRVPGVAIVRKWQTPMRRCLHANTRFQQSKEPAAEDPRLPDDVDDLIEDKFAVLQSAYEVPKNPIILAHGLLGFDELHLAGNLMPGIEYWYLGSIVGSGCETWF
jgi:hypothetical protein